MIKTTVLLSVPVTCPWVDCARMNLSDKDVDSRGALAIARINWLHKRWPQIVNTQTILDSFQIRMVSDFDK